MFISINIFHYTTVKQINYYLLVYLYFISNIYYIKNIKNYIKLYLY
jgi:hypothetical protein